MKFRIVGVISLSLCGAANAASHDLALDIKGTSLTELMNLKITSLSRKQEEVDKAPAAVYVITGDMIRRMGVTHIAEALRYAPGVEVARLNASQWAVTIRGFNSRTANKLLVMIDGRSIYSPLFSGVLWEEKDVVLEDVDRIEVIRGPGGTQWGANAVNGVINIITKAARHTQGGFVTAGAGVEERSLVQSRYGFQMGDNIYGRVYGKYTRRADSGTGAVGEDGGDMRQAGFRIDGHADSQSRLTLLGDVYQGSLGPDFAGLATPSAEQYHGGNIQLDWLYKVSAQRSHRFQAYFDRTHLDSATLLDRRNVWNLDYQIEQNWHNHEVVSGVGYRYIRDDVVNSEVLALEPSSRSDELFSAFFQDDIAFLDDRLHLILGTKYEYNNYSGEEWQPSIRTSYGFNDAMVWAAWSKSTRTPTRLEHDYVQPLLGNAGDERLGPERATIYELGWRKAWGRTWQLDIASYVGHYDDLMSIEPPSLGNAAEGTVRGVEVSLAYQPTYRWMLRLNGSHGRMDVSATPTSADTARPHELEGSMPRNMLKLFSLWDINSHWQLNAYLRYMGALDALQVDDYWVADVSVMWRPLAQTRVQLVGRHLGDGEHLEWGPVSNPVEPDWAIYLTQEF